MTRQNIPKADQPRPLDRATVYDPYPRYEQLRSTDPVHWNEATRSWILTRHQDVLDALKDPRLSAERITALMKQAGGGADGLEDAFLGMMLFSDPPGHTRLRSLANKAFTPRVLEGMRSQIQGTVERLLEDVRGKGRMEVISELAYPLPAIVISKILGVTDGDRERFRKWSNSLAAFLGNIREVSANLGPARQSVVELTEFLRGIVAQRRKEPQDDLLSALVTAEDQGDSFSENELYSMCVLLIFAGHETTANLIGNGVLALLRHPEQLEKLRRQPSLTGPAVEEIIRYDGPVQSTSRTALEDLRIGDKLIAEGDRLSLILGAANRDPAQFSAPNNFDIERFKREPSEGRHIGFGFGIHFCLGAALARMEGQAAIGAVVQQMPGIRLEERELEWRDNPVLRGLKELPVTF